MKLFINSNYFISISRNGSYYCQLRKLVNEHTGNIATIYDNQEDLMSVVISDDEVAEDIPTYLTTEDLSKVFEWHLRLLKALGN